MKETKKAINHAGLFPAIVLFDQCFDKVTSFLYLLKFLFESP